MFSGIVQGTRKIIAVDENSGIRRLEIDLTGLTENLQNGASVSVNGVCLTVVAIEKENVRFDVIRETLNRSNLDVLKTGDPVNIERSLKLEDEIGGHQVSGHVDTTGKISKILKSENNLDPEFRLSGDVIAARSNPVLYDCRGGGRTSSAFGALICCGRSIGYFLQSERPFLTKAAFRARFASSISAFFMSSRSIVTFAILPVNLNGTL